MPTMPPWARGGRIIWDAEHNLAYIRSERRGTWTPWLVYDRRLVSLGPSYARKFLNDVREAVLVAVGESIQAMVYALHPGAGYAHHRDDRFGRKPGMPYHLCGAPTPFTTATALADVTCPMCLAAVIENATLQAGAVGAEQVALAREQLRNVRDYNKLSRTVTGEIATEHDL